MEFEYGDTTINQRIKTTTSSASLSPSSFAHRPSFIVSIEMYVYEFNWNRNKKKVERKRKRKQNYNDADSFLIFIWLIYTIRIVQRHFEYNCCSGKQSKSSSWIEQKSDNTTVNRSITSFYFSMKCPAINEFFVSIQRRNCSFRSFVCLLRLLLFIMMMCT